MTLFSFNLTASGVLKLLQK